jgi:hypothetical protein
VIDQVLGRSVGVSESVFWAMIVVVAAACSLMIFFGLSWSVGEYSGVLTVLVEIGLTRQRAAFRLVVAFALVGAAAGLVGYFLAYGALTALVQKLSVRVFFHSLLVQQSGGLLAFSFLFPVAAVVIGLPLAMWSSRSRG